MKKSWCRKAVAKTFRGGKKGGSALVLASAERAIRAMQSLACKFSCLELSRSVYPVCIVMTMTPFPKRILVRE